MDFRPLAARGPSWHIGKMAKTPINPEAEALRKLYVAHSKASQRAEVALKQASPNLKGRALKRAVDTDPEVADISRRIKAMSGG